MIVKVCGMREPDNIRAVERAGADWMGFIFHPNSSRHVSAPPSYLPEHCRRVGVFVSASPSLVLQHVTQYGLHIVQLHGDESPSYCTLLRTMLPSDVQIIKMIPISTPSDLNLANTYLGKVDYFLFETKLRHSSGHYGGSGQQFDWDILTVYNHPTPFLITGGIGPDDAAGVREFRHPQFAGIDLNSRFETAPGLKDDALIKNFIQKICQ